MQSDKHLENRVATVRKAVGELEAAVGVGRIPLPPSKLVPLQS